jgi:hypothetical protein
MKYNIQQKDYIWQKNRCRSGDKGKKQIGLEKLPMELS